jgi:quercetin dioxygenase-like cupin family protein
MMADSRAHFAEIAWTHIASGAREKRVETAKSVMRIVEFSPGFLERDWCQNAHVGYVIEGNFAIQFHDSVLQYQEGDGICINAGTESEHKAVVTEVVTLFLVEPKSSASSGDC